MTELEVFTKSLEVSRVTLIVSLIVSLVSIVFASLEMAFQRSHNKKSMLPLCELSLRAGDDKVAIRLRNVGLGPLIVRCVALATEESAAEGNKAKGKDHSERAQADAGSDCGASSTAIPEGGLVIPPLETAAVLSFPEGEREALGGRELCIEYRDIYDRRFVKTATIASIAASRDLAE
jgi:hypothetical protein